MSIFLFDVVIPTLDVRRAAEVVTNLSKHSEYSNNYIIIDTGDNPIGYVDPCNKGAKAGEAEVVCFVNDDIEMKTFGWDTLLREEVMKNTHCFSPFMPDESNMRLNGWFVCQRRDYIDAYGWAFDPRFKVWCGDVDLIMRLEDDGIEHVFVHGIDVEHAYSKTCTKPELQSWIVPQQLQDLDTFREKWNRDANEVKVVQGT